MIGPVTRAIRWLTLGALALAGVAACATSEAPMTCPLPGQRSMIVAELFFGRAIPGRAPLTEAEWREFSDQVISSAFPDGFTSYDGEGQWRDPQTGAVTHEHTKILLVAVPPSSMLPDQLRGVIDDYRRRFDQKSVGLITRTACGAF